MLGQARGRGCVELIAITVERMKVLRSRDRRCYESGESMFLVLDTKIPTYYPFLSSYPAYRQNDGKRSGGETGQHQTKHTEKDMRAGDGLH
jgi:hypothetical protein